MRFEQLPRWLLRMMKRPPQLAYTLGLGPLIGRLVLLLTTTGRKSGRPRVTPLQYEELDEMITIGSSRGAKADWYRNIAADPHVSVRVKNRRFDGTAEITTDVGRIADFLELRLKRHPRMIKWMLRAEGVRNLSREGLEEYVAKAKLALVTIRLPESAKQTSSS